MEIWRNYRPSEIERATEERIIGANEVEAHRLRLLDSEDGATVVE